MIEMPCNYHRIEISMSYMWFIGYLSLKHSLNLRFEAEMQYDLF